MIKKALITGFSSGIGFAYAKHLANNGWHLDLVSQNKDRALSALDDLDFLNKTLTANNNSLQYLQSELNKLEVLFLPSAANFITTIWESEDEAIRIVNKLMEDGIIVRHLKSFGRPKYIRISTGLKEENKRLISQLKSIL